MTCAAQRRGKLQGIGGGDLRGGTADAAVDERAHCLVLEYRLEVGFGARVEQHGRSYRQGAEALAPRVQALLDRKRQLSCRQPPEQALAFLDRSASTECGREVLLVECIAR